jgi:hypothetical protein
MSNEDDDIAWMNLTSKEYILYYGALDLPELHESITLNRLAEELSLYLIGFEPAPEKTVCISCGYLQGAQNQEPQCYVCGSDRVYSVVELYQIILERNMY